MHRNKSMACLMLGLAVVQTACTSGWQTMRPTRPEPLPPDRTVRVWAADSSRDWRSVRVGRDSVSGIPADLELTCDTCRIALAREDVDSLQTATSGTNTAGTAIVIGIGVILAAFAVCVIQGKCDLRPYD